jgi:energy-coupling factor transport system ATP-binding protein
MPAAELKNIGYSYEKDKYVFKNLNFVVYKNEIVGLAGKTGSGKSTLAYILKGLFKPCEGEIFLNGKKAREIDFNRKAGIVFQYPEHQIFEETVLKDVMFGPLNLGFSEEESRKKALKALESLNFDQKKIHKFPFDLSGGEKKLVTIAGVLVMGADILILDEPTAGLDIFAKYNFLKLIFNLHKKEKNTIIFISHSHKDLKLISDRIFTIKDKKIKRTVLALSKSLV